MAQPIEGMHAQTESVGDQLQIIGEEQHFTEQLGHFIKQWDLEDKGLSYDVVAVFGSQSTGKSTLLNRLFGTNFPVMDERARRQTTKGIWMSRSPLSPILVMDVEGTDGRERGEDQDFERKSALFSMASAEVIIVNLWEHQVGLYQGANMGLLKTVFEVNLGLFQAGKGKGGGRGQEKTLLLFVIRDFVGATPLENLSQTLRSDLDKIWHGLSKPEGLENSQLSDYFDLSFCALPHKILMGDKFETEARALSSWFTDKNNANYVFKPQYHKRIPADGLPHYLDQIWQQVLTNKDLDLPTQQELLARFRCGEIAAAALTVFAAAMAAAADEVVGSGKYRPQLAEEMKIARQTALAAFDKDASRYHSGVYKSARADFLDVLNSRLKELYVVQLNSLRIRTVDTFRSDVLAKLKAASGNYDFGRIVEELSKSALERFERDAAEMTLEETGWSWDVVGRKTKEEVEGIASELRAQEMKRMIAGIDRRIKQQLEDPVHVGLSRPSKDMWDKILVAFKQTLNQAEETYRRKAESFNALPEEIDVGITALRKRAWLTLRGKIDEQTADDRIMLKLKSAFEDRFRYDAEGVPRVWRPTDDIDSVFRKARDETLELIPLYATISPIDPTSAFTLPSDLSPSDPEEEEFDFEKTLIIFTGARLNEVTNRFRREADAYYVEAKRSMVSSIAQIPYWMYGVVAVLGWNEFWAVLRSPVYFTMLLLMLGTTYLLFQFNMIGPVMTIGRTVFAEVLRVGEQKLREHFSETTADKFAARAAALTDGGRLPDKRDRPTPAPVKAAGTEDVELDDLDKKKVE